MAPDKKARVKQESLGGGGGGGGGGGASGPGGAGGGSGGNSGSGGVKKEEAPAVFAIKTEDQQYVSEEDDADDSTIWFEGIQDEVRDRSRGCCLPPPIAGRRP